MAKVLLEIGFYLLVLFANFPAGYKLEPKCWGPGVWPHPHYCQLFTLCLMDPSSISNMVTGHLFVCPHGMGFSAGRSACVPNQMVSRCHHNIKTDDKFLETSTAEHLLPSKDTDHYYCAGHTVPYCDGRDILVVCGPHYDLLGAVNCSLKSSEGSSVNLCDEKTLKCTAQPLTTPAVQEMDTTSASYPDIEFFSKYHNDQITEAVTLSMEKKTTVEAIAQHMHLKKSKLPNNSEIKRKFVNTQSIRIPSNKTEENSLLYASKLKSFPRLTTLLHGSNRYTSNNNHKEYYTCHYPGKQCTPENKNILLTCSDNLDIMEVTECISYFPEIIFQNQNNLKVFCDPRKNDCVIRAASITNESSKEFTKEASNKLFKMHKGITREETQYMCKKPGTQCTKFNNTIIIDCSNDLEVLHVWDCTSLFLLDSITGNNSPEIVCDPAEDSCVMYLTTAPPNTADQLLHRNDVLANTKQRQDKKNANLFYTCKHPGFQCTKEDSSVLLECSDQMEVLQIWFCNDFFPKKTFQSQNITHSVCDPNTDSCIIYLDITLRERRRRFAEENAPNHEKNLKTQNDQQISVEMKRTPAYVTPPNDKNHEVTNTSEDEFSNLEVPTTASNFKIVISATNYLDDDRNTTEEPSLGVQQEIESDEELLRSCQRKGFQCINNTTLIDCPDNLFEPYFIMSCSDIIQLTHGDSGFGFCNENISSCSLMVDEMIIDVNISLFDIEEHSVFPDFIRKCTAGGLYCADNETLVMCSGYENNTDYALSCGYQASTAEGQIQDIICDPQAEGCVFLSEDDVLEIE